MLCVSIFVPSSCLFRCIGVPQLVVVTIVLFIISLSVEGYLDCFQFGALVDKIGVNIYVELFMWTSFVSLE